MDGREGGTLRKEDRLVMSVAREDAGNTVGWYLHHGMGFTKAQIRSMKLWPEGIQVNGVRSRVTQVLAEGDRAEALLWEPKGQTLAQPWPGDRKSENLLEILYADGDVLAVWKSAGIVRHPGRGHYGDQVQQYLTGGSGQQGADFASSQNTAALHRGDSLYSPYRKARA